MAKKIILQFSRAIVILVVAVAIAVVVGYSSAMIVLMTNLTEFGHEIMLGATIVSFLCVIIVGYNDISKKYIKHTSESKQRDYFKDGNFSL